MTEDCKTDAPSTEKSVWNDYINILIGASQLFGPVTGVGRYTLEAARHLELTAPDHRYRYSYGFFTSRRPLQGPARHLAGRLHGALARWPALTSRLRRLRASAASARSGAPYDLYFEPNFVPLPIAARRLVVMVHDFAFHHHPQWVSPERLAYLREKFYSEIRRADLVVAGSAYVRDEALDILKLPSERVAVVPEGVDREFFRPEAAEQLEGLRRRLRLPRRFILAVGAIEARKNLRRLLQAYDALPSFIKSEHPLLLAGPAGGDSALAAEFARHPGVRRLGYVSDRDLPGLYAAATLFVYPSLYEGFGLPPLEAMACGTPVAASRTSALPEVLGSAAALFDPHDIDEMSEVMRWLLESDQERGRLSRLGRWRAEGFSWDKTAHGLLAAFAGGVARQEARA